MTGPPPDWGDDSTIGALAGAVHDATNSLTVLLGWLERAAKGDDVEAGRALERARDHALLVRQQMRQAIGAQPIEGTLTASRVSAPELLEDTYDDLQSEADQAGVELRTIGAETLSSHAAFEPNALTRVLTNILLNAIAVSPKGASITTYLSMGNDEIHVHVQDCGPGIPEERRADLFRAGVTTRHGGAGIGLRHAFDVTHECGGTLALLETDEEGACFGLTWPTAAASKTVHRVKSAPTKLDGLRMLMLEDDVAIVELLELSLPARGAELQTVESLDRMREALAADAFDILLMDLSPIGDHLDQVLGELRDQHPAMGLIVTSGSVTVALRDDVRWLRKPFTPDELAAAIRRERPGNS